MKVYIDKFGDILIVKDYLDEKWIVVQYNKNENLLLKRVFLDYLECLGDL